MKEIAIPADSTHQSAAHHFRESLTDLAARGATDQPESRSRMDTDKLVSQRLLPHVDLTERPPDRSRVSFEHSLVPAHQGTELDWLRNLQPHWITKSANQSYSITIGDAPDAPGKHALHFQVRPGDRWDKDIPAPGAPPDPEGPKERAEISNGKRDPMHSDRDYSFKLYLPSDFPKEDNRLVLAQWWQRDGKSPPLSVRYEGGHLKIVLRLPDDTSPKGYKEDILFDAADFPLGSWNDFRFKFRWSDQSDGKIDIWMNGVQIIHRHGANCYPGTEGPIFKFGIYRHATDKTYDAYFRDVETGPAAERPRGH